MDGQNERYKAPKRTRKTGTVRQVTLSEDAKRAYEDLLKSRDEKQKTYGRHLDQDNKTR